MSQHSRRARQHTAAFGRRQTTAVSAVRRALAQVSRHVARLQQSASVANEYHKPRCDHE